MASVVQSWWSEHTQSKGVVKVQFDEHKVNNNRHVPIRTAAPQTHYMSVILLFSTVVRQLTGLSMRRASRRVCCMLVTEHSTRVQTTTSTEPSSIDPMSSPEATTNLSYVR